MSHYFTPLQRNRRLGKSVSGSALATHEEGGTWLPLTVPCASMDLIALGLVGTVLPASDIPMYHSVVIHRTLSWQKLLTISCGTDLSASYLDTLRQQQDGLHTTARPTSTITATQPLVLLGPTALTWSPHGRSFVLGLSDGSMLLYDLESYCHEVTNSHSSSIDLAAIYSSSIVTYVPPPQVLHTMEPDSITNVELVQHKSKGTTISKTTPSTGQRKRLLRRLGKTPDSIQQDVPVKDTRSDLQGTAYKNAIIAMTWIRFSSSSSSSHDYGTTMNKDFSSGVRPIYDNDNKIHRDSNHGNYIDADSWNGYPRYLNRSSCFLPPTMYHYSRFFHDTMGKKQTTDSFSAFLPNIMHTDPTYILGYHRPSSHGTMLQGIHKEDRMVHVDPQWPRPDSILSALCVLTSTQSLHVHLHGRFPILTIHPSRTEVGFSDPIQSNTILCTMDLSTLLTWNHQVNRSSSRSSSSRTTTTLAHLYTIPRIRQERYPLQIISSFHSSILSHLSTMNIGIKDIVSTWNSALRPLDLKLEPMVKLFKDYGLCVDLPIDDTAPNYINTQTLVWAQKIRLHVLQYMVRGYVHDADHPSSHGAVSNALDHFFTHASMNDVLLQRLQKSIQSNLADVEGMVRKYLMGPIQALLYDVYELYGYTHYFSSYGRMNDLNDDETNVHQQQQQQPLIDTKLALDLCKASEGLKSVVETCIHQLIEVRFRVTNMVQWLRGTAAQVKARGTPMDSIQRDTAKKKRLPESIIQHMANFLSLPLNTTTSCCENPIGWTESILGILWSNLFVGDTFEYTQFVSQRPVEAPSFKVVFEKTINIATSMFQQPRQVLSKSTQHYEIVVEREMDTLSLTGPSLITFHKRCGGSQHHPEPGFVPQLIESLDRNHSIYAQRQWLIAALYYEEKSQEPFIEIIALPLDSLLSEQPYYLSSRLLLSPRCHVKDMAFYGDDGCSSFKVEHVEAVQEGRQALGLIMERDLDHAPSDQDTSFSEELWLFEYDSLKFKCVMDGLVSDDSHKLIIQNKFDVDGSKECAVKLKTGVESWDGNKGGHDQIVFAKSRVIQTHNRMSSSSAESSCPRLILSGARGIGGVQSFRGIGHAIDLFDLEEDEETEE